MRKGVIDDVDISDVQTEIFVDLTLHIATRDECIVSTRVFCDRTFGQAVKNQYLWS